MAPKPRHRAISAVPGRSETRSRGFGGRSTTSSSEKRVLLEKYSLKKALRIMCWVRRFIHNTRSPMQRRLGLIQYEEMEEEEKEFVREAQAADPPTSREADLNLTRNSDGLLECRGEDSRPLPNLYSKEFTTGRESGRQSPQPHPTRASLTNHGQGTNSVLDPPTRSSGGGTGDTRKSLSILGYLLLR